MLGPIFCAVALDEFDYPVTFPFPGDRDAALAFQAQLDELNAPRTRAAIEAEAEVVKGSIDIAWHHNRHTIPALNARLAELRTEWKDAPARRAAYFAKIGD